MRTVYVDDSGYTGANLLNRDQPVFVLGSIGCSEGECGHLSQKFFSGSGARELHFAHMRKTQKSQNMILEFLRFVAAHPELAKISYAHKAYALVAKIVDLLIEPAAHSDGLNLYAEGLHIAFSNLLYYTVPAIEGDAHWHDLLSAFQAMCRNQSRLFYDIFGDVLKRAKSEKVKELYVPIEAGLAIFNYSDERNKEALDLPFTSMLALMSKWRAATAGELSLVHDKSSAMYRSQHDWNKLTSPHSTVLTLNSRGSQLPVAIDSTKAEVSHLHPGLQLADILAGSVCKYLTWIALGKPPEDVFASQLAVVLDNLLFTDDVADGLWPSLDFTPEELDRVGDDGSVTLEHIIATLDAHGR